MTWLDDLREFYTTEDGPNTRCFCDDGLYPRGHSVMQHQRQHVTLEDEALFAEIAAAASALIDDGPPLMDKTCLICHGYLGAMTQEPPFGHREDCKWERLRQALEA